MVFAAVLSIATSAGCIPNLFGPGATPVNQAIEVVQNAINALNANSASWQQELEKLESVTNTDVKNLINNDVTNLMQRSIGTAGVEFRCNLDFIGARVKDGLAALLAKLRGTTPPAPMPAVCQVSPSSLDMGARPVALQWYGYNFDSPDVHVVLKYAGGEVRLDDATSRPTHYLLTLDTSLGTAAPLCNRENRQIVLRYRDAEISSVGVVRRQCPTAPPAPAPQPLRSFLDVNDGAGPNAFGNSEDHTKGGQCDPGYHRVECKPKHLSGSGTCNFKAWTSDDAHQCECVIHFGAPSFQSVQCEFIITEAGDPEPPPPTPECPCW